MEKLPQEKRRIEDIDKVFNDFNSFTIEDKERFLHKLVEYYGGNMIAYLNLLHKRILSRKP